MATSDLAQVKDDMECPLCLDTFKDPVTLSCGHCFCNKCLDNYIKAHATEETGNSLPCCVCRQETVPSTDTPVEQRTETEACDENCSVCNSLGRSTLAALRCSECEMSFCERCAETHPLTPATKDHQLDKLKKDSRQEKETLVTMCPEHNSQVDLLCRKCNKPICQTCCDIQHNKCDDVVTLDSMMDGMKLVISQSRRSVVAKLNKKRENLTKLRSGMECTQWGQAATVSKIRNLEETILGLVQEKFQKDVDEVNKTAEEEKSRLRSEIHTEEMEVKMFEKRSTMLKEALESEASFEVYKTHEICQSGSLSSQSDPARCPENHLFDLDYSMDLEIIKKVLSECGEVQLTFEDDRREKFATGALSIPVMVSEISTRMTNEEYTPRLQDITTIPGFFGHTLFVTDYNNCRVKSFRHGFDKRTRSFETRGRPRGITKMKGNKVMVAIPDDCQLITLGFCPELTIEETITTKKGYSSLEMMADGKVLASGENISSVDVLDVKGKEARVVRSFDSIDFVRYITMSRCGSNNIILAKKGEEIQCITLEGDNKWRYCPEQGTPCSLRGVTVAPNEDVIFVNGASGKITILTKSGKHKADLLIPAGTQLKDPMAVHCNDKGMLYVTDEDRILLFKLPEM